MKKIIDYYEDPRPMDELLSYAGIEKLSNSEINSYAQEVENYLHSETVNDEYFYLKFKDATIRIKGMDEAVLVLDCISKERR